MLFAFGTILEFPHFCCKSSKGSKKAFSFELPKSKVIDDINGGGGEIGKLVELSEVNGNSVNSISGDCNNYDINAGIDPNELQKHPMESAQMPNRVFECYLCKKTIKTFTSLRRHMKIMHRKGKAYFNFDQRFT